PRSSHSSSCPSRSRPCRSSAASRSRPGSPSRLTGRLPGRRLSESLAMGQNADFMPIDGWDHLELYVGNAKQSAFFYEHAFGFTKTAYAGPETGVRDRASYVLEQDDIRLVLTSGLGPDSEITRFACAHGDGVKDTALTVPDAANAYREAVQRG